MEEHLSRLGLSPVRGDIRGLGLILPAAMPAGLGRFSGLRYLSISGAGGEIDLGAEELSQLVYLHLHAVDCSRLRGMEALRGLRGLALSNLHCQDLGLLGALPLLERLDLVEVRVERADGIAGLVALRELNVINTQLMGLRLPRGLQRLQIDVDPGYGAIEHEAPQRMIELGPITLDLQEIGREVEALEELRLLSYGRVVHPEALARHDHLRVLTTNRSELFPLVPGLRALEVLELREGVPEPAWGWLSSIRARRLEIRLPGRWLETARPSLARVSGLRHLRVSPIRDKQRLVQLLAEFSVRRPDVTVEVLAGGWEHPWGQARAIYAENGPS